MVKELDAQRRGYGGTDAGLNLPNSVRMDTPWRQGLTNLRGPNVQIFEREGDIDSRPPLSQRTTGGEQQMKLPPANEPYVSNADTVVALCRGGFPRSRRIRCKIHRDLTNSILPTIEHHRDQSETFPCETVASPSVRRRDVMSGIKGALLVYHPS
jgi:hypothetical protein